MDDRALQFVGVGLLVIAFLVWTAKRPRAATPTTWEGPLPWDHEPEPALDDRTRARKQRAQYEQSEAIARSLAVVQARHARASVRAAAEGAPIDAPVPLRCPCCGVGDIRLASILVPIYHEDLSDRLVTPIVRKEAWCVDCAPLITGGWVRAAPKETW